MVWEGPGLVPEMWVISTLVFLPPIVPALWVGREVLAVLIVLVLCFPPPSGSPMWVVILGVTFSAQTVSPPVVLVLVILGATIFPPAALTLMVRGG